MRKETDSSLSSSGPFFRLYTPLQLLTFTSLQSALFIIDVLDGGIGAVRGFAFVVISMVLVGVASGLTSKTMGQSIGVFASSLFLGAVIVYFVLTLPAVVGIADGEVYGAVDGPFGTALVLHVILLGPSFVFTVIGTVLKGMLGLPED